MPISDADRDAMIRTVMGEAGIEPPIGQAAVAHVILNRMATGRWGDNPTSVVKAKGQFEPWFTRRKKLEDYKPQSPEYQKVGGIVDSVLSGQTPDPTGGATHFLEPTTVRKRRGGSLPDWAQGPGLQIGRHAFYRPPEMAKAAGKPQDAIASALGFLDKGQGPTGDALPFAGGQGTAQAAGNEPWEGIADKLRQELKTSSPADAQQGAPPADAQQGAEKEPWDGIADRLRQEITKGKLQETGKKQLEAPPPDVSRETQPSRETAGQTLNRWVQEHPGSSPTDIAVQLGVGGLRGVGNIADTLAQGITWAGEKGASALGYGEPAKAWRKGIEDRIASENAAWNKNAPLAALVGQAAGNVLGGAVAPGAGISRIPAVASIASRVPAVARLLGGGAALGGLGAVSTSSMSDEPLWKQAATGAGIGLATGGLGAVAGPVASKIHHLFPDVTPSKAVGAAALGALGMGYYTPDDLHTAARDLLLLIAASKGGAMLSKIGPKFAGAAGTIAGREVSPVFKQEAQ